MARQGQAMLPGVASSLDAQSHGRYFLVMLQGALEHITGQRLLRFSG